MYVMGEGLGKIFHSPKLWANLFFLANFMLMYPRMYIMWKGLKKILQPWGIFYLFSAASWEVYKAPFKLVKQVLSCLLLMSVSEAFSVTFTLNKIYTKLWVTETVFGPRVISSSSDTMNPVASVTVDC